MKFLEKYSKYVYALAALLSYIATVMAFVAKQNKTGVIFAALAAFWTFIVIGITVADRTEKRKAEGNNV